PVLLARAGQNFEVTLDVGQGERAKSAEIIEEKDDQRSEQQQADPPQVGVPIYVEDATEGDDRLFHEWKLNKE
ncbi:unnamed protein product, partial [Symbiodinium pilosum]